MEQKPSFTTTVLVASIALALLLSGCLTNDDPEVTDSGSETGNDATSGTNGTGGQLPSGTWTEDFHGEFIAERWVAWDEERSTNGREIRFSCARNCGDFEDYRVSGYDSPMQLNEEWNLPPRAVIEVMFFVAMSPEGSDAGSRFDLDDDVQISGQVVLQN